jgi:hypothetical protein
VGFALAVSGCHGVPGAFGLDAIEQPDGATRRAGCDQEFGVQPAGMVVFRVGGVFAEPSSLTDALGQIFREVLRVSLTAYSRT